MTSSARNARNLKELARLNPEFRKRVERVIYRHKQSHLWLVITSGLRTQAEQNLLYSIGRRGKPGEKIVTKTKRSRHLSGNAADVAFVVKEKITWDMPNETWAELASIVEEEGLVSGADFGFGDLGHMEMPKEEA